MQADTQKTAAYQFTRAPRGASLSCKGWQQEAVLRMLLNSLDPEVAERPQDLVIGGAAGKAAADWESLHAIVASLRQLNDDESLAVESGKPAGVFRAKPHSPRLLATGTPDGPHSPTIGDWLYAGTQTALPELYEIYAAASQHHFGGTLAGKLVIGGGMGSAGGAQPLAAALNGAAFLGIEADSERIKRRVKSGYCEVMVNNLDEALRMLKNAVRQRKSASIGLIGNCADLFPQLARRGVVPDLLTNYTPSEADFDSYVPAGLDAASATEALRTDPDAFRQRVQESVAIQHAGARDLEDLGARVITAANALECVGQLSDDGWRLTTWIALSGESSDVTRIDKLALEIFRDDERVQHWLPIAGRYVRFQGLPVRVTWLRESELSRFSSAINDLVARREISAPVLLGYRLRLAESDPRSSLRASEALKAAAPSIETGACWVWLSGGGGPVKIPPFTMQAMVADGTAEAGDRLSNWPMISPA